MSGNKSLFVMVFCVVLAFVLTAGFTLWSVHNYESQSQRQGLMVEQKICTTLSKLSSLKPPPGNPATNPSRGYLQDQHTRLDELAGDLGCRR